MFTVKIFYTGKNGTFKSIVYVPVLKNPLLPTEAPTEEPDEPIVTPPAISTTEPTTVPTTVPTAVPTAVPTTVPTAVPTAVPTTVPTAVPTAVPSANPFDTLTIVRVGDGNVTVNNRSCSFSGDTAIEKVTKGMCTVEAVNSSNSRFKQWINSETKEILSTSSSWTFDTNSITKITAVFETVHTVTFYREGGRGKVTFNGKEIDFVNNVGTCKVEAGVHEFAAIATDDYDFVSATYGNTISNVPMFTVPVTNDNVKITVNFVKTEKTVTVTYQHDYGQVLVSQAVAFITVLPQIQNFMMKIIIHCQMQLKL